MLNYRFDIRIDKCKQMQSAYYLRRIFTRDIIAKFAKEDVVYLNGIYPSVIKKIVYNMPVHVHVDNDMWQYIPVRTPENDVDEILKSIIDYIENADTEFQSESKLNDKEENGPVDDVKDISDSGFYQPVEEDRFSSNNDPGFYQHVDDTENYTDPGFYQENEPKQELVKSDDHNDIELNDSVQNKNSIEIKSTMVSNNRNNYDRQKNHNNGKHNRK